MSVGRLNPAARLVSPDPIFPIGWGRRIPRGDRHILVGQVTFLRGSPALDRSSCTGACSSSSATTRNRVHVVGSEVARLVGVLLRLVTGEEPPTGIGIVVRCLAVGVVDRSAIDGDPIACDAGAGPRHERDDLFSRQPTADSRKRLALIPQSQQIAMGRPRAAGAVGRRRLRGLVDKIGMIQLDAIRIVERTQFVVPFSRLGPYDIADLQSMSGPGGDLLEGWGHAASWVPMAHQPLFRWRTAEWGRYAGPGRGFVVTGATRHEAYRRAWWDIHADYAKAILREVSERGPLTAAQLSDPRRQNGTWWERRSVGRQALEMLFAQGDLAAWRTPDFERVYDLVERVIPPAVLDEPTPPVEEAHRRLLMVAARALGVATVSDLVGYFSIKATPAKPGWPSWLRPVSCAKSPSKDGRSRPTSCPLCGPAHRPG
jgi:hypothetical protein